ncbi:hypothetical protein D3C78_1643600 [compost metagenome]
MERAPFALFDADRKYSGPAVYSLRPGGHFDAALHDSADEITRLSEVGHLLRSGQQYDEQHAAAGKW